MPLRPDSFLPSAFNRHGIGSALPRGMRFSQYAWHFWGMEGQRAVRRQRCHRSDPWGRSRWRKPRGQTSHSDLALAGPSELGNPCFRQLPGVESFGAHSRMNHSRISTLGRACANMRTCIALRGKALFFEGKARDFIGSEIPAACPYSPTDQKTMRYPPRAVVLARNLRRSRVRRSLRRMDLLGGFA